MGTKGILHSRRLTVLGLVVLLIGFAPAILATVNIDTVAPVVFGAYPNGTSSAPQVITPSTTYEIYEILLEKAPAISEAWVEINGVRNNLVYERTVSTCYYYYTMDWTAPSTMGTTITFVWKAKDAAGNIGSYTSYAITASLNGDFYINNQKVGKDATITLNTRTLDFTFVATSSPDQISSVWVNVVGQDGDRFLTKKTSTTWGDTTWIAPADGTYTIYGYIGWSGGNSRLMSILTNTGSESSPPPTESLMYDYLKIIGGVMVIGGLIFKK